MNYGCLGSALAVLAVFVISVTLLGACGLLVGHAIYTITDNFVDKPLDKWPFSVIGVMLVWVLSALVVNKNN